LQSIYEGVQSVCQAQAGLIVDKPRLIPRISHLSRTYLVLITHLSRTKFRGKKEENRTFRG